MSSRVVVHVTQTSARDLFYVQVSTKITRPPNSEGLGDLDHRRQSLGTDVGISEGRPLPHPSPSDLWLGFQ